VSLVVRVNRQLRLVALASAAVAVGCSSLVGFGVPGLDSSSLGDGGRSRPWDGGAADPGGLPLDDSCAALNAAKCEALDRCGLLAADGGVTACLAAQARLWCGPGTWPSHVAVGTLRYDPVAAQGCLEAWAGLACPDVVLGPPAACGAMLVPSAAFGRDCYDGYRECSTGVCRGAVCPRRCEAPGIEGEVCTFDTDCDVDAGLFCRLSSTPGVGLCAAPTGRGAACDDGTRCAGGLSCVANRCQELPAAGGSCLESLCGALEVCTAGPDGGLCLPRKGLGEACQPGQCQAALGCFGGRCEPLELDAGVACVTGQTCPQGTACVGLSAGGPGRCLAPIGEAMACGADQDCSAELACVPQDGGAWCRRRLPLGASCLTGRACPLDAVCADGRCLRAPLIGEPCAALRQCGEGRCAPTPYLDGGFVCAPLSQGLEGCATDAECASGACFSGRCRAACSP